jgi:large subunit ribosomal protein L13
MLKLRIFPEEEHPFPPEEMDKFEMPPRKVREIRPRARRAALRAQTTSTFQKS